MYTCMISPSDSQILEGQGLLFSFCLQGYRFCYSVQHMVTCLNNNSIINKLIFKKTWIDVWRRLNYWDTKAIHLRGETRKIQGRIKMRGREYIYSDVFLNFVKVTTSFQKYVSLPMKLIIYINTHKLHLYYS